MRNAIYTIILIFVKSFCFGQADGTPDLTFGVNGRINHDFGSFFHTPYFVVDQPDDKIITTGGENFFGNIRSTLVLVRWLENGAVDTSFGINGIASITIPFGNFSIEVKKFILQNDGKFLVLFQCNNTQYWQLPITRLNNDGTLDTSFGTNGFFNLSAIANSDPVNDFELQSDNKILVTSLRGSLNLPYITRLNTDGTTDTGFGTNGFFRPVLNTNIKPYQIVIQSDGKFLINGYDGFNIYIVARYNQNTTLDTSYGNNGRITFNIPYGISIFLQSDDKCLVNHSISGVGYISRFTTSGVLDSSFNNTGNLTVSQPNLNFSLYGFKLQSDKKQIWYGTSNINNAYTNTMLRFNSNGSKDNTFGT
ncbi:MAG: hypothetical protein H7174_01175, partial [Flavobacterium sp.]|nr:hypothetical protein [Flavobacterium sp.]